MAEQVRASTWRGFHEYVQQLGGDAEAYLLRAGVDPAVINQPDAYVSCATVMRSLEIAAAELGRPDFGLQFGLRQGPGVTGPLMFAVINCQTARESMLCAAEWVRFHNHTLRLSLDPLPGGDREILTLKIVMTGKPDCLQQIERTLSFLHSVLRRLGGGHYAPQEIWVAHQPLAPVETYAEALGIAPRFGQRETGIVMTRAFLDIAQPGRSEKARQLAVAYLEQLCAADATVTQRVRAALEVMMRSGDGSQAEVAHALAMHERTLQRRLKQEGAVFEDIKDDVRREMATAYLRQPNLPLSQVAEMLGYAEPSALSRSCRRWFGESPRAVRKRLAA